MAVCGGDKSYTWVHTVNKQNFLSRSGFYSYKRKAGHRGTIRENIQHKFCIAVGKQMLASAFIVTTKFVSEKRKKTETVVFI